MKPGKGSATVSVDFLRHPVSAKVRQRLLKALDKMASGEHDAAIGQLLETLKKYPDSAAYVYSLLGVEYARTNRFDAAVHALEQGALLLPHEAMAHYNFGLALICAGDYDRAAQEVQRALELDPKNTTFQARLNALQGHVRSGN
ncbi:MAG: tetratricopeptide repeat protein [Bryobacteraceae bacterium]